MKEFIPVTCLRILSGRGGGIKFWYAKLFFRNFIRKMYFFVRRICLLDNYLENSY